MRTLHIHLFGQLRLYWDERPYPFKALPKVEPLLAYLLLNPETAIRIFLQQVVHSGGLPFQPTSKKPNSKTGAAMKELEEGGGKVVSTTEELFG